MPAPLIWDFKITGADEAASQLQQVGEATRVANTDSLEYAKSLRQQARNASAINNESRYMGRIFMSNHPILRNTVEVSSIIGHVARSAAIGQQLLSLSMIALGQNSSTLTDAQDKLAQAHLNTLDSIHKFGEGSIQSKIALEQENEASHHVSDAMKQQQEAQMNAALSMVTTGAMMATSVASQIPQI